MKTSNLLLAMSVLLLSAAPAMAGLNIPDIKDAVEKTEVKVNPSGNPSGCTYAWAQTGGLDFPVDLTTAAKGNRQLVFIAPEVGPNGAKLVFTLTVTGSSCADKGTYTSSVNVINANGNAAPNALFTVFRGSEAVNEVSEGDLVTLNGSASNDPDGDNISYNWEQTAGPVVTLSSTTAPIVTFTAPNDAQSTNGASLTFKLTVADVNNLSTSISHDVTVKWANDPPDARLSCPVTAAERTPVTLDGTSYDSDDGIASYDWKQTAGGPTVDLTSAGSASSITFEAPSLASTSDTMTFALTVADKGGLRNTKTCDVKVLDITPPDITGTPADIIAEATSAAGAAVTFTEPTASDKVDGSTPVTCVEGSGSIFALDKKTTVTCTAHDKASSRGPEGTPDNTATTSFSITVQDTTAPTLTLPAPIGPVEGNTLGGAIVTYTATASDFVDGNVTVTCDKTSGSTFPVGSTAVSCSTTDAHTNTATAGFTVTVQDTTPPAITDVPANITAIATSTSGAAVTFTSPKATDLVDGPVTVTCIPAAGSTFALGTTAVTCNATDAHGNNVTAGFNVTVNYGFNGLLSPYNASKAYKIKSAIPLKWQYTTSTGAALPSSTAKPTVLIYLVSQGVEATSAIELDDAGASGYQYDSSSNTWQFNWKTTGLNAGTYDIYIQSGVTGQKDGPAKIQLVK